VCVDDFALKKCERYGTVMVNIETGKVVDILESRDYDDVEKWFESFPNIQVFSRDGSITYAKAMRDSHPKAIQISDRFHLLKNLTDYCKDYIKRIIKNKTEIESTAEIAIIDNIDCKAKYQYETTWDLITYVKNMRATGYLIEQISSALGLSAKTIIKYSKVQDCDKEKYNKKSTPTIKSETIRRNKETLMNEAKAYDEKGYSIRKIADEMSIDRKTVKKYLASDGTYKHASLGNTRTGKLSLYKERIIEMYSAATKCAEIFEKLKKDGYGGSESLIRNFTSKINHQVIEMDNSKTEQISRKHLISLLYKDIEKIKSITVKQLNKVFEIYPELRIVYEVSKKFKELLMGQKIDMLNDWIINTLALGIPELTSFINGINRDIEAVKNAIIYKYSNGLAEVTVNKIKVVKRIMYGRCGFDLLKRKVLYANFN
jgi:predicted transcriptional regulator